MKMSSNEKVVERFLEFCVSEGLSKKRIDKYGWILRNICKWLKVDFKKATKENIQKLIKRINESDYKAWTKRDYKVAIKKFYKWLEGDNETFPKKVMWIKVGGNNPMTSMVS